MPPDPEKSIPAMAKDAQSICVSASGFAPETMTPAFSMQKMSEVLARYGGRRVVDDLIAADDLDDRLAEAAQGRRGCGDVEADAPAKRGSGFSRKCRCTATVHLQRKPGRTGGAGRVVTRCTQTRDRDATTEEVSVRVTEERGRTGVRLRPSRLNDDVLVADNPLGECSIASAYVPTAIETMTMRPLPMMGKIA